MHGIGDCIVETCLSERLSVSLPATTKAGSAHLPPQKFHVAGFSLLRYSGSCQTRLLGERPTGLLQGCRVWPVSRPGDIEEVLGELRGEPLEDEERGRSGCE